MTSSKDYREFAFECMRSAEKAEDEQTRKALFDMARLWMQAALESNQSPTSTDDGMAPAPQN